MKKIFLLTCCLVLLMTGFAQLGIKAGAGITNVPYKDLDHNIRSSFNIGLYLQHPFSKKFTIQPELVYSVKGFNSTSIQFNDTRDNNALYQYLNLPVMA